MEDEPDRLDRLRALKTLTLVEPNTRQSWLERRVSRLVPVKLPQWKPDVTKRIIKRGRV